MKMISRESNCKGSTLQDCKITVAGVNVLIKNAHSRLVDSFVDYSAHFEESDITVLLPPNGINIQRNKVVEDSYFREKKVSIRYNASNTELIYVLEEIADKILLLNVLLMHGAVVAKDSQAYVFLAASGTGKSTRVRKWLSEYPESVVINGDKPFIKFCETGVFACGSPWCGKEGWNTNRIVPIRAFFILERADEEEKSTIEEISLGEAFPSLLQHTHRPNDIESMRKVIQLLKSLDNKVYFYRFHSKPTREAVRLAYETACPR